VDKPGRRIVASRYAPKSGEGEITPASLVTGADREVEVMLTPTARLIPKVGALLGDTFHIVQEELSRMKELQRKGHEVSVRDVKLLGDLLFTLTKEVREDEKRNDVSKLDDEAMLREILKDPTARELVTQILLEYEQ
jgi:hypothetical protein